MVVYTKIGRGMKLVWYNLCPIPLLLLAVVMSFVLNLLFLFQRLIRTPHTSNFDSINSVMESSINVLRGDGGGSAENTIICKLLKLMKGQVSFYTDGYVFSCNRFISCESYEVLARGGGLEHKRHNLITGNINAEIFILVKQYLIKLCYICSSKRITFGTSVLP